MRYFIKQLPTLLMQRKIPDTQACPILKDKNALRFGKEVRDWFNERSEFLSTVEMPHYLEDFSDIEKDFMSWFIPETVQPFFSDKETERRSKRWESTLQKARVVYQRAVEYMERSGSLYSKPKPPSIRFHRAALVIEYFDPQKEELQEFSLTRNTILASVCEKVYGSCRQKGGFIGSEELYEHLRKNQPKCSDWEPYRSSPLESWKRLYENVRSVNRWSDKHFSQQLFSCDQDRVMRLL